MFSRCGINGTWKFISGFFLSKEKPERFVPTESIWTENITSLPLFFSWIYQDNSGQYTIQIGTAFQMTCTFSALIKWQLMAKPLEIKGKSHHFIASLTQTCPTGGTELPLAAALDPGGTGVFRGPIKSWAIWAVLKEMFVSALTANTSVFCISRENRAASCLAFVPCIPLERYK